MRGQGGPCADVGGRKKLSRSRKGVVGLCSPYTPLRLPCPMPLGDISEVSTHSPARHHGPQCSLTHTHLGDALPPPQGSHHPRTTGPLLPPFRYLLEQLCPPGCLLPAVCLSVGRSLRAEEASGSQLPPSAPPCCHPRTPQLRAALLRLLPPAGVGCLLPVPLWGWAGSGPALLPWT